MFLPSLNLLHRLTFTWNCPNHGLNVITNRIQEACGNVQHGCGIYVDFKKVTFDTVNHYILLDKLELEELKITGLKPIKQIENNM